MVDTNNHPDLVGVFADANNDYLIGGQTDFTFHIKNQGNEPVGTFHVDILYSDDQTMGNGGELVLQRVTIDGGLAVNETIEQTVSLELSTRLLNARAQGEEDHAGAPAGTADGFGDYIGIVIDPDDDILEADETNNFGSTTGQDIDKITHHPWDVNGDNQVSQADIDDLLFLEGQSVAYDDESVFGYPINYGYSVGAGLDFDGDNVITAADGATIANYLGHFRDPNISESNPSTPLEVTLALNNDTGDSATDRITSDPVVVGLLSNGNGITSLQARLGKSGTYTDILNTLQSDGSFMLDLEQLSDLNGGSLPENGYAVDVVAKNSSGAIDFSTLFFAYEPTALYSETELVSLNLESGTVSYDFQIADFDSVEGDVERLEVYLVNVDDPMQTLLSSGASGEPLITVTDSDSLYDNSLVSINGEDVSLNLSSLSGGEREKAALFFKVLTSSPPSADPDSGSSSGDGRRVYYYSSSRGSRGSSARTGFSSGGSSGSGSGSGGSDSLSLLDYVEGDGFYVVYEQLSEEDSFTVLKELDLGGKKLTLNYDANGNFEGSNNDDFLEVILESVDARDPYGYNGDFLTVSATDARSVDAAEIAQAWTDAGLIALKTNKDIDFTLQKPEDKKLFDFQEDLLKASQDAFYSLGTNDIEGNALVLRELVELGNIYAEIDPQVSGTNQGTFLSTLWQSKGSDPVDDAASDLSDFWGDSGGQEAKLVSLQKELLKEVLQYETSDGVDVDSLFVDVAIQAGEEAFKEKILDESIIQDEPFEKAWSSVTGVEIELPPVPYATNSKAQNFLREYAPQIVDAGTAYGFQPELIAAVLHYELYHAGIEDSVQNFFARDIIWTEGDNETVLVQQITALSRRIDFDLVSFGPAQMTPGTLKQVVDTGGSFEREDGAPFTVGPTLSSIRPSDWETDKIDAQLRLLIDDSKAPLLVAARLAQILDAWEIADVDLIERFGTDYAYRIVSTLYPLGLTGNTGVNTTPEPSPRGNDIVDILPQMTTLLQEALSD